MKTTSPKMTTQETKTKAFKYLNELTEKFGADDVIPVMQNIVEGANKWYGKLLKQWVANLPEMPNTTLHSFGIRYYIKTTPEGPNQPGGPAVWAKLWLHYSEFFVNAGNHKSFDQVHMREERSFEALSLHSVTWMNRRSFEDAKVDLDDNELSTDFEHDSQELPEISLEEILAFKPIHKCHVCGEWMTEDEVIKGRYDENLCEVCSTNLDD